MNIARMASALAAGAAALAGAMVAAAPAHADAAAPAAATASALTPAAAADFTKSLQVVSDNTNLDAYAGNAVLTRNPQLGYQNWEFWLVGRMPNGNPVYVIRGTQFATCLQDAGVGNAVVQRSCNTNNVAQRWIVDPASGYTTVESFQNPAAVLQGNGLDQQVTLAYYTGAANQWWMPYNK